MGVGEDPVGVEPVAQGEEVVEPVVRRRQVRGRAGVHLAPVRAPARLAQDRLEPAEVGRVVKEYKAGKVEQEFVQKAAPSAEHTGYNFLGVELLERV